MGEFWRNDRLPHLESRRSCQVATCYRPHTHDRFSVGLIDSGSARLSGISDEAVVLESGDVIVIPAGHVHACNPDQGRWQYQMIHAEERWIAALAGSGASQLMHGISVYRDPSVYDRFDALNARLFSNRELWRVEGDLADALRECSHRTPVRRWEPDNDPLLAVRLSAVLEHLLGSSHGGVLDEAAQLAGMSRYELIRITRRATGLTPIAWRQDQRIIAARRMLREGSGLAETAAVLGFTDQSHFHRVFRAHVAATPGAYRG
jgi:AraC-like DNA-binding protein